MPKTRWTAIAPLACMLMIAACATAPRPASPAPPRLTLPERAEAACDLAVLPPEPTLADLEAAYMARGVALLGCDAARRLALEVLARERAAIDAWLARPAKSADR